MRCLFLLLGFTISCARPQENLSTPKYDPDTTHECPAPDALRHYIEVPAIYDLASVGARLENIPSLSPNPHAELLDDHWDQRKIKLYYEMARPYDPSKEILFLQQGGPGGDHHILHEYVAKDPELADRFNVVAMDHRGVGCSHPLFPGDFPFQSLLMRYAAADIEAIRKDIGGADAKINVFGVSYGTMLAQTYALLFPGNLNKLALQSAFSKAEDFDLAQAKFESLAISTIPGQMERYQAIKTSHPDLAKHFVLWAVRPMYRYWGRVKQVPENFDRFEEAIHVGDIDRAMELTLAERFVMPWMTRSIACVEIFKVATLYRDEFKMFPFNFDTCSEFEGSYEYFDYTEGLRNIGARTLIMGGLFDLVTPIEAMQVMSSRIPDNYFYMDMHLSHSMMQEKPDCYWSIFNAFLAGADDQRLRELSLESRCVLPPPPPAD